MKNYEKIESVGSYVSEKKEYKDMFIDWFESFSESSLFSCGLSFFSEKMGVDDCGKRLHPWLYDVVESAFIQGIACERKYFEIKGAKFKPGDSAYILSPFGENVIKVIVSEITNYFEYQIIVFIINGQVGQQFSHRAFFTEEDAIKFFMSKGDIE